MNKEYKERMERADDAAGEFFELAEKSGNIAKALENDDKIQSLYLNALDVAEDFSEEETNFYFNFTDYFLYKVILLIRSGAFAKQAGNKKCFTSKDLAPVYKELTGILDAVIEQNDRRKPAFLQRKADIISSFHEELSKHGMSVQKGGCYIATAVYGSYDCPQVWTLRRYRDSVLAHSLWGRTFIHVYYALSPTVVKWFGKKKWFRNLWRDVLDMLIYKLQDKGYADTLYSDLTPQPRQVADSSSASLTRKEEKGC